MKVIKNLLILTCSLSFLFVLSARREVQAQIDCDPKLCNCPILSCLCTGDCEPPPPDGCTGPNSCSSSECCVQGACEPKNGGSCSGEGGGLCPAGTQPNPISPWPDCTFAGNPRCCCPLPQSCPGNIACGTSTTVPNGQCGLITCNGPVCPTTPPGGCSSNPSSCGVGKCCVSNVCGSCPAPTPTATPVTTNYVSGRVYKDTNNNCTSTSGWVNPDPNLFYGGASITLNAQAPVSLMFGPNTSFSIARSASTGNTLTLSGLPAGYRCSDCNTGTCPIRTGVTSPSNNNNFYITNAAASPTPPPALSAWWQVKDGEATTNGNLTSKLPAGSLFNIVGLGGFHGLPVFGGSLNTGSGTVSTLLWNANTQGSYTRVFDYSYFENLIPDDVVLNDVSTIATGTGATTYSDGYQWYRVNGNYTINSDINFGTRKVILFVKSGNLTINGKVNLDDNQGFFGTFVNGSISINPALTNTAPNPAIEGIFLSDTTFTTGAGNSLLHLRGSVVSLGNITLDRNLSNNATNAELFEFAPDLISLFPEKLRFKRTKWTEVAP